MSGPGPVDLERTGEGEQVARLRAELDAAERRMEALARGVSHDLRAPLRAIDGFAAKLARDAASGMDDASRDALARIQAAAARMGGLIDRLQALVRVGRHALRPARVDISLLADWCAAELQDAEPAREARIEVQPGLWAVGDERLLKLLLEQLLGNAWRFSASRPRVEVEVGGSRDDGGLDLYVRDRGIGFDMAYAGKLFEPFQRLHGTEEGAGDGIGLSIAEQVVARHGGSIRAEATVGEGATFHLRLPDLDPAPTEQTEHTE